MAPPRRRSGGATTAGCHPSGSPRSKPLGTDWRKPHLTDAPVVIVVCEQAYGLASDGAKLKHYYVRESVGIAVGLLLAALNDAGFATLTHTPSPMASCAVCSTG